MFILTTALIPAVLLIAHSTAILIRPPRPNIPDRPSLPKPIVPVPIAPRPINPFGAEAAQQEIFVQGNIQKLEDRLGVLGDGVDFAGNMIEAILPTTTTTSDNTGGAQGTHAPPSHSQLLHFNRLNNLKTDYHVSSNTSTSTNINTPAHLPPLLFLLRQYPLLLRLRHNILLQPAQRPPSTMRMLLSIDHRPILLHSHSANMGWPLRCL
ncbi:hypothetical protein T440DRAFT_215556 [Plenodomus tracheiphilus IPT5]|uniref:Uncharacterized protein n=1 Tax=Plenodomus tracheiphilus IPT5 TaxID=1408161 RepID=A0A6A7AXR8_9PLEO|nr:hypothetical protein T440DRAFT_215556 [Plenodomus tracheiphilus IPT5]